MINSYWRLLFQQTCPSTYICLSHCPLVSLVNQYPPCCPTVPHLYCPSQCLSASCIFPPHHCLTALLFCCLADHFVTALLFFFSHCFIVHYLTAPQPHFPKASLLQLSHHPTAQMPQCITSPLSLPHWPQCSFFNSLPASLFYCLIGITPCCPVVGKLLLKSSWVTLLQLLVHVSNSLL